VLALQRSAGNAAVARRMLARVNEGVAVAEPVDTRAVPVEASDPKTVETLTLAGFSGFAERQADWASQRAFLADAITARELRAVLVLAHAHDGALLSAAGELPMSELRVAARTGAAGLTGYAAAVKDYGWSPATTVDAALAWGKAATTLTAGLGAGIVKETVKQGPLDANIEDLIAAGAVEDFVDFVKTARPVLSANNGTEVRSFLALRAEGGWRKYVGTVGPVRNIHHFTKAALEALHTNVADTSRAKPLAIVLHSTVDHDGAFHRDAQIARIAASAHSTTIVIEGSGSLAGAGGALTSAVAAYGQGSPPKARQIMLAGHGNSRMSELAGERDEGGAVTMESIDLDANAASSLVLIRMLITNLEKDPAARLVLNGCLTAAGSAQPELDRGTSMEKREAAHDDLRKALRSNRSLADTFRAIAAQKGITPDQISASNSSIGSEVTLFDEASGEFGLRSDKDPLLTSADKFAYLEQAGEATGAGRALVECLLVDTPKAKAAAEKRLEISVARSEWDDCVIKALLLEALKDLDDIAFINSAAKLAGDLSELQHRHLARPSRLNTAPPDVLARMLTYLETEAPFYECTPPYMELVAYQVWMLHDDSNAPMFLKALGQMTVQEAADMIDLFPLPKLYLKLFAEPPGPLAAGKLRLALLDVDAYRENADSAAVGYLRNRRQNGRFADAAEITAALGGRSSAAAILEHIKEPEGDAAAPDPKYNIRLGDGQNDFYVKPMFKRGMTYGGEITVYAKPDILADELGTLKDADVDIIGKTGDWYCFEFGADKKPGFSQEVLDYD
jgi:hypothetical protein